MSARRLCLALYTVGVTGCGAGDDNAADTHDAGTVAETAPASDAGAESAAPMPMPMPMADAADASPMLDAPTAYVGVPFTDSATPCGSSRFATGAGEHAFGTGQNVGQDRFPDPILGPPRGGGCCQGSLDVVSLGNGGFVVVEFAETAITDGPGADFIVFENPFAFGGDPNSVFAELGTVAVSDDGETWTEFECTATMSPYGSCSGWQPVYANADTNDIDPTDPAVAGGDAFDLADIGVARARFVRITDRADLDGQNGVYDLDAVAIVNAVCL